VLCICEKENMMKRFGLLAALLLTAAPVFGEVPIRSVTLFEEGLAEITRAGSPEATGPDLELTVPEAQLNDLLKSLVIRGDATGAREPSFENISCFFQVRQRKHHFSPDARRAIHTSKDTPVFLAALLYAPKTLPLALRSMSIHGGFFDLLTTTKTPLSFFSRSVLLCFRPGKETHDSDQGRSHRHADNDRGQRSREKCMDRMPGEVE
jgi:hypothetical protein